MFVGVIIFFVEWVIGLDSFNKILECFGIFGIDFGIFWDNGDFVNC